MSGPNQIDGAPHPRDTERLFGQDAAQQAFLEAFATGRLHHAWLLTGPRGIGKATLAWSIARFLLATPLMEDDGLFGAPPAPTSLTIDPEHPVARRIAAGAEPGLKAITRTPNPTTDRMRDQIVVDDIRSLAGFFQLSATDGGRRVVLVDAADEMNPSAANALLKMLEEPPERATLLLISHQPSGLLPTIRSRCRTLRLQSLSADDMAKALDQAGVETGKTTAALAELASGSVGAAIRLSLLEGLKTYGDLTRLIGNLPQFDRAAALKLAETAAARGGEAKRDLLFELIDLLLSRLARTGATGSPPPVEVVPREAATLARLAPHQSAGRAWAHTAQETGARARHGRAVNLDPAALVLDTLIKISQTATG
ncbi:DNA polymerase III subunit delta' [Roseobacter sp. YSTF-M11]|uniref:DNA polymerase III subunit delta n=1 Tax=Roseobacter insulae TaxID=2859783 RepID=A0A9X1K0D9_9RHOB|nr:DNA polymerase III subunit delta' [Roseobacter insulae]MBW4710461.1 DNA polymerase III subunit delta' [Roseobacter insulae]